MDEQAGDFVPILGGHGHFAHDRAEQVQVSEHGGFKEVGVVYALERELRQRLGADGDVAVGRVENVPVAGGGFGQEAQSHVAEAADERHLLQGGEVAEAVALGVIGLAADERGQQAGQVTRVHLPVAVYFDDDLRAELERLAEARHHRAADAAILFVADENHASILTGGLFHQFGGPVGGGVVHHDDVADEVGQAVDDRLDLALDAIGRDDGRDVVTTEVRCFSHQSHPT